MQNESQHTPPKKSIAMRTLVGEKISERRLHLGETQAIFAERLGVTRNYLASIECGRKGLSMEQLAFFADVLNVELWTILPSLSRYREVVS